MSSTIPYRAVTYILLICLFYYLYCLLSCAFCQQVNESEMSDQRELFYQQLSPSTDRCLCRVLVTDEVRATDNSMTCVQHSGTCAFHPNAEMPKCQTRRRRILQINQEYNNIYKMSTWVST